MLTRNINNDRSFKYNQMPQKKKMQLHNKMLFTLATSLLFTVNYGNLSCFATQITQQQADAFKKIIDDKAGKVSLGDITEDKVGKILKDNIQKFADADGNKIVKIESDEDRAYRVTRMLIPIIVDNSDVFADFNDKKEARTVVESLLKMYNQNNNDAFNDPVKDIKGILKKKTGDSYEEYNESDKDTIIKDAISAILKDAYYLARQNDKYKPGGEFENFILSNISKLTTEDYLKLIESEKKITEANNKNTELTKEKDEAVQKAKKLEDTTKSLKDEIAKLKAKDLEKSDPKTQVEIKQKEEELKQAEQELKKNEEAIKQNQKIIDQQNRPEVIKVQEKLQIAQAPIEAQTYAVQNITAIQSSIMSNITDTRMNINQYDISTSEDENKPVAAGPQTVDACITPKSWDIWASGHMGNIKQDAASDTSTNSKTNFYGGSIGIDKIFANNSVFGLALSYGQSNTEYQSKTANEKWESNYYQANAYIHHNFTNNLFVQLIGGIGTYGKGTSIGNMFDFSSQKSTFGYHGNATIGYSIFGGENSNFAITPQLGVAYYHLSIPDSILGKTDSSTFTTLGRFDGIAGLNIKIFNLNSNSNSNVKIIPEITVVFKSRLGDDNVEGINADNLKLPVVKSTNSNDLSANVLATPEQLFTLGGALTVVTNNSFSIRLNGSVDFATQYLAMVGGISVKLSF